MRPIPFSVSEFRGKQPLWNLRLRRAQFFLNAKAINLSQIFRRLLFIRYRPRHDRIEIDITYACNLYCANCNRSSSQVPDGALFGIAQIEKFVRESIDDDRRWKLCRQCGHFKWGIEKATDQSSPKAGNWLTHKQKNSARPCRFINRQPAARWRRSAGTVRIPTSLSGRFPSGKLFSPNHENDICSNTL